MPFSDDDNKHVYFRHLFDTFKVPLHDYLQKITGSHEVAQDIAQEIFAKLWRKSNELNAITNIDQYIFRMAHNESMNFFNRTALDAKLIRALKSRIINVSENVSENLQQKELQKWMAKGVASLSPQRRKVYELSRQQGLSIPEIAGITGLTPNTVKNHLVEALRQLREFLARQDKEGMAAMVFPLLWLSCL